MAKSRTTQKQRKQQQEDAAAHRRAEKELAQARRPLFGTGGGKKESLIPQLDTSRNHPAACLASLITNKPFNKDVPVKYEGEAAEREAKAQEEIARKKKRVAPMYNKGGYQYLGDDVDPTQVGSRKI